MSKLEQCPSTKDSERTPEVAAHAGGVTGRRYWRSLDEASGTKQFREFVEREFPAGASELLGESRRDFVKLMGASVALAGAATLPGCRRPEHHIMPYSAVVPEQVIPGKALYYATAMPLPGGGAEGLLAETHEGRPTKIEGNPLHPVNRGKTSIWAQASVLSLYDPDRLKHPVYLNPSSGPRVATWDDFKAWSKEHFAGFDETRGRGLAFLVDKKTSPTRNALKARIMRRWPEARWHAYSPSERSGAAEGARIAFGSPARVHYDLTKARRIVSLAGTTEANEAPRTTTVVLPRCGPVVGERECTAAGSKVVMLSGWRWKSCALSDICTSMFAARGSAGVWHLSIWTSAS